MTITLQVVNELIASLESAGELSIREQKFLKLAKAYHQLAAENMQIKAMNDCLSEELRGYESDGAFEGPKMHLLWWQVETPATDRIVAGIKADGRVEGAHFVANRMLAAWGAGFIEDTAKNAADIARMILTSTEFMADAPEGDFDRSFADGILEDIAQQLREGADK
ncbi:Eae protein [Klebsiella pneumoniae]|uniref:Eae protein n=1 Tax=Klebsiella pneumoniae TaxID=573 RepID=UPI000BC7CF45|nr:Eae protein [Klebsiella pneumoniae]MCS6069694.1 ead/Ea22-like family protein [Klebsiella pneumoniae subsp. pneumoniae]MDW1569782.1 ead/Ea22-like family protein [Klebsiella pneumoniae]PCQ76001.1 Eae protein [Klebsiella pneumoniae]HBT0501455.1 ead/Ea22-like family protein [Klebsiella pneumoniae]